MTAAGGCVPEKGQEGDCHWAERCSVNAIVLSPSDSHLARENLGRTRRRVEVVGLVDSGATVNVLPYDTGLQLGGLWEDPKATIKLAGNLGGVAAQPIFVMATIGDLTPIRLIFAWSRSNNVPLILGQMNFFMEFEVCFFRKQREFEIKLATS